MHLFRSEEHIDRWSEKTGVPRGDSFSMQTAWQLARELYTGRMASDWRRKTSAEYEAMFRAAGLTSEFWSLTK